MDKLTSRIENIDLIHDLASNLESHGNSTLRRIGQAFCGPVWPVQCGVVELKGEDGEPGRSIRHDFIMHRRCLEALRACQSSVTIPERHQYVSCDNVTWWSERLPLFSKIFSNVFVTQRIQPFRKENCDSIIDVYPVTLRSKIENSDPDQGCLIRPDLGRRGHFEAQSRPQLGLNWRSDRKFCTG